MNPELKWTKQFEVMKSKMYRAMSKLRSTSISVANAYIFFNMYLIIQVYFGCGIIILSPKQEEILMQISESILLKKLGLSEKFPRKIIYAQKSELGVGILKPTIIIAILALKLYLSYKRNEDRISNIIMINEMNIAYQYGYNKYILQMKRSMKPTNIIWSNEITQMLEIRKISLHNIEENSYFKTQNKTIMDLTNEYINLQNLDKEMHVVLNQVHLYKQMNLLCELVGLRGNRETEAYRKDGVLSYLK